MTATLFAGVTFTAETTVTGEGQQNVKTVVNVWVEGDKGHIEFVENNANPMAGNGTYIITTDGGKTMYLVNPEDKNYMKWDMSQMMSLAGNVMNMVKMSFDNARVEKLEESDGGKVLGHNTRRYKHKTSYDLSMKIMGIRQEQSVESVQESWTTSKYTDMAMGAWLRNAPTTGNEGLDKVISDSMKTVKGFPLKTKTRTITKQYNKRRTKVKRQSESLSDMVVTKLKTASVSADKFKIPEGYQEVDMFGGGENSGRPSFKDLFKRNQ
jgi:hypothetical protein